MSGKRAALLLLPVGLLPVAGQFTSPTLAWGWNHAIYLPRIAWILALAGWIVLLIPPARRLLDRLFFRTLPGHILEGPRLRLLAIAAAATVAFVALRTPTHFLGDGVLVGELAGLGSQFRGHDAMDYLFHRLVVRAIAGGQSIPTSFAVYAWGSWIAGFLGVTIALFLLRGMRIGIETKALAFFLWIFAATTLLYCGYVESYGYLSIFLLGFLWSGAMAQRGEVPPWLPGLFYGLSLSFHTTALFAGPALLYLALRPGPPARPRGRWALTVLAPAAIVVLGAIAIHVALGFDEAWFRREFLESKNQRQLLVRWTGSHGILTWLFWKDLANWILLVTPVTGLLLVLGMGRWRRRLREPEIAFLSLQLACFLVPLLLLDRKLGAARDWDLLAAQAGGLPLLVARLWEGEVGVEQERAPGWLPSARLAAVWVSLLLLWPWLAVNASREASLRRFDQIRRDFPTFQRAYAAEELAKYHRERQELEAALALYRESVATYPKNPRTRILLGSSYFTLGQVEEAEAQYDTALAIDPKNMIALDMKGRIAVRRRDFASALAIYRKVVAGRPADPDTWAGYGFSALQMREFEEARRALTQGLAIRRDPKLLRYLALADAYLSRWNEAIEAFRAAIAGGAGDAETFSALAATHEARHAEAARSGGAPSGEDLEAARETLRQAVAQHPSDPRLAADLARMERILSGRERPRNLFLP